MAPDTRKTPDCRVSTTNKYEAYLFGAGTSTSATTTLLPSLGHPLGLVDDAPELVTYMGSRSIQVVVIQSYKSSGCMLRMGLWLFAGSPSLRQESQGGINLLGQLSSLISRERRESVGGKVPLHGIADHVEGSG
jgi:hypothetical protein